MITSYDRREFIDIVTSLKFKSYDNREAREFGRLNVYDSFSTANHRYAKYWTVSFDGKVLAAIMLQRDGNLIYFVTTDFISSYSFQVISDVKTMLNRFVPIGGPVFVTTANWYKQAVRFVGIVGFKKLSFNSAATKWVYDGK